MAVQNIGATGTGSKTHLILARLDMNVSLFSNRSRYHPIRIVLRCTARHVRCLVVKVETGSPSCQFWDSGTCILGTKHNVPVPTRSSWTATASRGAKPGAQRGSARGTPGICQPPVEGCAGRRIPPECSSFSASAMPEGRAARQVSCAACGVSSGGAVGGWWVCLCC